MRDQNAGNQIHSPLRRRGGGGRGDEEEGESEVEGTLLAVIMSIS